MRYVSTRGGAAGVPFEDVLLEGLAPDGGLYVPETWPAFDRIPGSYPDLVASVAGLFGAGDGLEDLAVDAYRGFDRLVPITELGDRHVLELFWGPTYAFKDYALQWLGRLLDRTLRRRSERLLVIGATSGDTGSAAIAAVAGLASMDIVVLHPHDRVSEVQRRQMTTVSASNVHNIAIEGTFDDCQRIVKTLLARQPRPMSSVNSINWVRVMGQIPYYVYAVAALDADEVDVVVPTGNFGNVYSAWAAKRMGAPIRRLIVGTNVNRATVRFFEDGSIVAGSVVPTIAPAMDIQIPSNLERLVFELVERDGPRTASVIGGDGLPHVDPGPFEGHSFTDAQILDTMHAVYERYGTQIDPHTAVAVAASESGSRQVPTLIVGTAHPAKFPAAVFEATGRRPAVPSRLAGIEDLEERFSVLPASVEAVEHFLTWKIGE